MEVQPNLTNNELREHIKIWEDVAEMCIKSANVTGQMACLSIAYDYQKVLIQRLESQLEVAK